MVPSSEVSAGWHKPLPAKCGSFSSEDHSSSVGHGFSWADEMEAHLSELSEDISAEEHTSEGTSPPYYFEERSAKALRKVRATTGRKDTDGSAHPRQMPGGRSQAGAHRRGNSHNCHAETGESCTDAVLRVLKLNQAAVMQCNAGWEALRNTRLLNESLS